MFETAVKTTMVEAVRAAFAALGPTASDTTLDLTPKSVTLEYPLQMVQWPSVFINFNVTSGPRWMGLNADTYRSISGSVDYTSSRLIYFEGTFDFQILALHSEERDRLKDTLYNLILMGNGSPASSAFYSSIVNDDLVGLALSPDSVQNLGSNMVVGSPWSPEDLVFEAAVRAKGIGNYFEIKYNQTVAAISGITISGTPTVQFLS